MVVTWQRMYLAKSCKNLITGTHDTSHWVATCLSSSSQQQQIILDSTCIIHEPTTVLSYTAKKLSQCTSSNSGGEMIIVKEVRSNVDDMTEWSSKKIWTVHQQLSKWWRAQGALGKLCSILTDLYLSHLDGQRSYERVFILQCYDITADNSNKFKPRPVLKRRRNGCQDTSCSAGRQQRKRK